MESGSSVKYVSSNSSDINPLASSASFEKDLSNTTIKKLPSSSSRIDNSPSESSTFSKKSKVDEIERYVKNIIHLVRNDEFIEGELSKTQMYLEKIYASSSDLFGEIVTKVWLELYSGNNDDLYVFASISSYIPYEWLSYNADSMMLGCSSHEDPRIIEACLRMAESWEETKFLHYLKKIRSFEQDWLETYKNAVIKYLDTAE